METGVGFLEVSCSTWGARVDGQVKENAPGKLLCTAKATQQPDGAHLFLHNAQKLLVCLGLFVILPFG